MASSTLSHITPSQLCSSKSGMYGPSQALLMKPMKSSHGMGIKGRKMKVSCMATSVPADRVPDMGKRELLNLLLLGALSLPSGFMLVPYATFFAPPGSGGGSAGSIAKDALGNDIVASEWLKTHGPGDRTLSQGLKGDPTYLVVENDRTLATYGINAVCTHLGCVVPFNKAENKFMCPCHGSQYNNQGRVVRGPAPLSLALAHADIDPDTGKEMSGERNKDSGDIDGNVSSSVTETEMSKTKKKKKGIFSRTWNAIFRSHGDDFEKRLQHISKEEASVLTRVRNRSQNWRRITRHFILLSVLLEVIAVGYAIMTTRTPDLNWKMRALRVLPMFLLPGLSFLTYLTVNSLNKMFDRKDQKTLERLRAERQAKIDELKEKTNYYITQQLIQRYDPDPAAKAAAATILASKLGADSGLKVYLGDDSKSTTPAGKSNDVEVLPSKGLRNRKQSHTRRVSNADSAALHPLEEEMLRQTALDAAADISQHQQMVVEHRDPTTSTASDGGWIARIAALLVGEDPAQSYALICGNCHMHNGLARKEDFPFITYYCPHCNALNQPKQHGEQVAESNPPRMSSSTSVTDLDLMMNPRVSTVETVPGDASGVTTAARTSEAAEKVLSDASGS